VSTINELFPGRSGRLQFIRVMLALRMPELRELSRDEELPPDLERKLRETLERVRRT